MIVQVLLLEGLLLFNTSFFLEVQAERTDSGFSKKILKDINRFVFVEYFCNRSPEKRIKNFKTFIQILAIVTYQNWLNASPPLNARFYLNSDLVM